MVIIGHRGAAALEPENTLRSIKRAMAEGVDAVEIDVHLTRDGQVVVIHDDTVDRTTDGTGAVRDLSLSEIRALDAGKGEKVPTLHEVLDLVRGKVLLVVELKAAGTDGPVVAAIHDYGLLEGVLVISFWHRLVKSVKERDRRIKTGVLLVGCPVDSCVARSAGADALLLRYSFVDREFVAVAHAEDRKVFVWNIDDPRLISAYVDMGVDGIASNDPRILVDYFRKGGPALVT